MDRRAGSAAVDIFVAIDATRDGRTDILIANNRDGWTGVLTWRDNGLHELWGSPSPLRGPAGQWNRRDGDVFHAITYQGAPAVSIIHPGNDAWHGILAWDGHSMVPVVIEKLQQTTGSALFTLDHQVGSLPSFVGRLERERDLGVPTGASIDVVRNTSGYHLINVRYWTFRARWC